MATQQYVLAGDGNGSYQLVVHYLTPAGSNAAGTPWSAAVVNSGRNTTVLLIGTGPGQILQADHDAIIAGTMIEVVGTFGGLGLIAQAPVALNILAATLIANDKARLQAVLNFYGFSQGAAA